MLARKADILARLQKEILKGHKPIANRSILDPGLGKMKDAFPGGLFPLGAVHEFLCFLKEDEAATCGFISGLLSSLMRNGEASLWISSSRTVFPPALKSFGITPDKIIFVDLQKEKDVLWTMEEALKCDRLAAVIGEIKEISFIASRRLQLAVEQSRVTGFIIRRNPHNLNTIACVTRWRITSLPSLLEDDMPGVGFPRWKVELLKVRNGRPGNWEMEWRKGSFRHVYPAPLVIPGLKKKTG